MTLHQAIDHFRFAGGANFHPFLFLELSHLRNDAGASHQKFLNAVVDIVDFVAKFPQIFLFFVHIFKDALVELGED